MMLLAMDRATMRSFDKDERLDVEVSNISKANVCPYWGSEIPGWQELGLAAERKYLLLRDPEELAKAAPTFRNLPVLITHIPTHADAHPSDETVGTTGSDVVFADPYLQCSLKVWTREAIDLIESEERKELSCGYHYVADMAPGTFRGLRYDGIMRDIVGNHVALVSEGRAGPDVMVGDAKMKSRTAFMVAGAVAAYARPKLAADAKFDLKPILKDVTGASLPKSKAKLATDMAAALKPLQRADLAADEGIEADDLADIILAVQGVIPSPDDDEITEPMSTDDDDDAMAFLKGLLSEEQMATFMSKKGGASDEKDDDEPKAKDKEPKGMDAAMIHRDVLATVQAEARDIREAERLVRPIIGELDSVPDTAVGVYKLALDAKTVDTAGVEATTANYRALVKMIPVAGEPPKSKLGLDQAHATATDKIKADFPRAFAKKG